MASPENNDREFIVKSPLSKLKVISILLFIFISTSSAWYYYEYQYLAKQPIPLLQADSDPTRIKPIKAGGALMPNTDKLVYESLKSSKNELSVALMPEPEEPVAIHPKDPDSASDKIDDIIGNILSESEAPAHKPQQNTEADAEDLPPADVSNVKTLKIVQIQGNSKKQKKAPIAKEAPSYYRMQLVSVRSESAAAKEWERLKKLHAKQLGSLSHIIQKVNIENKGIFYRLLAGQFTTFGQAKATCKKLMNAQQNCVIIRH